MNLSLDADLFEEKMDTISADSFISNGNSINISNINLLSATDKKELSLSPLSTEMDSSLRQTMAESIIYSGGDVAYGNIVGSNIYNALFILGTVAIVKPLPFGNDLWESIIIMAATTALLIMTGIFKQISRVMGVVFLIAYAGYIACLI